MVKENSGEYIAQVKGNGGMSPLLFAVIFRWEEMVYWLYYLIKASLNHADRIELLLAQTRTGFRDYTPQLLEKYNEETVSNQQGLWEKIKKCFNRFLCSIEKRSPEMKLLHRVWELAISNPHFKSKILEVAQKQISVAAEQGNIEFLKVLIHGYPDLIFHEDNNNGLMHEIGSVKDFIVPQKDKEGNNILHLAMKSAPPEHLHSVSGAALQMQRELLWFEAVKKLMNPLDVEAKNRDGKTPRALFSQEHQKLKDDGEKWMKDTANYCMVVAALMLQLWLYQVAPMTRQGLLISLKKVVSQFLLYQMRFHWYYPLAL